MLVRDSSIAQPFVENDENAAPVNVSDLLRSGSTEGMQRDTRASNTVILGDSASVKGDRGIAIGYKAQTLGEDDAIAIGYMSQAMGKSSVAIGSEYNEKSGGKDDHTTAKSDYSTAVGAVSKALGYGSTAIGHRAKASNKHAISFGFYSEANGEGAIAIGVDSKATVSDAVAIGRESVANRAAGKFGYDPRKKTASTGTDSVWKSTRGGVSVGDVTKNFTRQIMGVSAGTEDGDAVNVAQLKALQEYVDKGWNVSVGDANATAVSVNKTLDFSAESSNLKITKGKDDNKLKFDLAKDVTLSSAKVAGNTLDATGLVITGGPKITTSGIDAGSKKITGIQNGTLTAESTEAVNGSQLLATNTEIANVRDSLLVKQEAEMTLSRSLRNGGAGLITIGKGTGGTEISILNKDDGARKLSGLLGGAISEASDEAVSGAQLHSLGSSVAKSLGGNASYGDGTWTTPTFTVKSVNEDGETENEEYSDVASAFAGVGTSITNVKKEITNQITNAKNDSLNWSEEENAFVAQHGEEKSSSKIKFLANGDITSTSSDAVAGNQLHTLGSSVAKSLGGNASYENGAWGAPTFTVKSFTEEGDVSDSTYNDVASAFIGVGSSFEKVKDKFEKVKDEITKEVTAVQGDALLWDKAKEAFAATHGEEKSSSKITSLANGDITATSSDAVAGNQLHSLGSSVATYFGGGASYENGTWTAPKFTVKSVKDDGETENKEYSDVASAFAGVGTSLTNVQNNLTEQVNNVVNKVESESFVQQDETTHRLTIGAAVEGGEINIANKNKEDRILSGVKAATQNNEAVNKGQLDESLKKLSDNLQSDESAVVHYDKKAGENGGIDYTSVTFGGKDKTVVGLHNVADGKISKDSHDVITGGQVNKIGEDVAKFLGGDSTFKDGSLTEPTYKLSHIATDGVVTESSFQGVGTAFSGLDTNIKTVNQRIKEVSENVAHDSLLWNDDAQAFVARHEKSKGEKGIAVATQENSKITFLAAGDITGDSTDAVNGSQLHTLGTGVASYFGGDAKYENGQWTAPSFKVTTVKDDGNSEEKSYGNVAEALAGVGTSLTNVKNEITNEIANVKGDSLVKKDANTNFITIGKEVEGSEINISNKDQGDRTLSGVKTATKDNEAVNKGQLDKGLKDLSNSLQSDESAVVHYDKKAGENGGINYESITLGGKDKTAVGLHNVANGEIAKDSRDAITGDQINTISQNIAGFLGGNASFENGTFKGPVYNLSSITSDGMSTPIAFTNVGLAFEGLDKNIKTVNDRIKEVSEGVAHDSLLWNDEANAFVARHEKKQEEKGRAVATQENSKITFLHAGDVSKDSTDAITGGQLYSMGGEILKYLGGGAKYENGQWTKPDFKVAQFGANGTKGEEKTYHNVAEAFEGVNSTFTTLNDEIGDVRDSILVKQATEMTLSRSLRDGGFGLITIGKGTGGNEISILNKENGGRKLSGLLGGTISKDSDEAVSGGQVHTLGSSVAKSFGGGASYEGGAWTGPSFKVTTVNSDGKDEEKSYGNVAEALADVGTSFTNINKEINKNTTEVTENIKQNALMWNEKEGVFVATHGEENSKTNSKIKYLANGDIAESSTDAITGSQLHTLGTGVATYFGGGAEYKDGKWTAPSYNLSSIAKDGKVTDKSHNNVGSAFEGLDDNIKNVNQRIKEVSEGVAHDSLLWSDEVHAFVARHEKSKGEKGRAVATQENSKITFLLDGAISKDSTDAVNGSQLYSLGKDLASYLNGDAKYEEDQWSLPKFKVTHLKEDGTSEEAEYDSVAEAFSGVGNSFTNVVKDFKEQVTNITESVQGDALLWDKTTGAFVAQHGEGKERANSKITSLANGSIVSGSSDAVNGGQIYDLNQTLAGYLGGGASYNEKGEWISPKFKVKIFKEDGEEGEEESSNVSDAFDLVNQSFTDIHKEVNNKIEQVVGDSLVKQDADTKVINIGKEVEGTSINIANESGVDRTLSGVKKAENDNEAVNKGQLDKGLKDLSDKLQSDDSAVVLYDKKDDENSAINYESVTLGKGKEAKAVALHNVAAGNITEDSRDAVNGGQINTISGDIAKFLGGATTFTDGVFTGPTYKLSKVSKDGKEEEAEFKDVGTAFEGLDTSIKNVNQRIKEVSQGVAQDSLSWSKDENAFIAQHGEGDVKGNSKIKSLKDGDIAVNSTDAVNGSQLYSTNTTVSEYFGGDVKYEDGKWTKPDFKVAQFNSDGTKGDEQSYHNVSDAFEGVNNTFTTLNGEIGDVRDSILVKQATEMTLSRSLRDGGTGLITIGKETGGSEISILNKENKGRKLSGLLDGDISENSNEAISGGQIHTLGSSVAKYFGGGTKYESGAWTGPTFTLKTFTADGKEDDPKDYSDVASAFAGIDDNIKNVNQRIKEVSEGVAHDSLLWNDEVHAFVARHEKSNNEKGRAVATQENSKITFLLDGAISKDSTDAITGGQLYSMSNTLATYFGGGAEYKDGQWTDPSFKVKQIGSDGDIGEESYNNVAEALSGVGNSFKSIHDEISTMISGSLVKQEDKTNRITVGAETDGGEINIANKNKEDRTLSGVKKAENDNEAVNKGQLDKSLKDLSDNLQSDESAVVHYDKKDEENGGINYTSVTLGKGKDSTTVGLHNVADGSIASGSSDAVTGGQLYTLGSSVAKSLGGEASYESGKWVAPSFKVKTVKEDGSAVEENSYDDIVSAFAGVGTSFENLQKEVTQSNTDVTENIKQNALLWSDSAKAFVAQHGEEDSKTNSKITSLAAGSIASGSSDAVTGGQLYSLNQTLAKYFGGEMKYEDDEWSEPTFTLKTYNEDGTEGDPQEHHNVAEAFAGIDKNVQNIVKDFKEQVTNITQEVQGDALLWDKTTGAFVAKHGEKDGEKTNSKITSLANGSIVSGSSDAVNGGQIYDLNQSLAKYFGGDAK
ncbi:hypothetical protein, partial [Bartonella sp. AU18XJBT]|uniref:hypothetical protein n=1 Tax=Bartonella sp. AU18XJBT TaxID=3019089 RepID=UPI00235FB3EF